MKSWPDFLPEDALIAQQSVAGPLEKGSITRYRAYLRHGLRENFEATGRMAEFEAAFERVDDALKARKAKIPEEDRRTSAKKHVDATEAEAEKLFYELKRHGLKYKNPNSILAGLFVLVAGHCGFRPIEMRGAVLEGEKLILLNAKKRPGQDTTRVLDLSELHKDVLMGLNLLLKLIDHDLSKREFAKWQKCLAGQITRACERVKIRNLSLYSFRHVAIATWTRAGLSALEIAKLCGHLSIRTAHAHYARGAVGHDRDAVARAVDEFNPALAPIAEAPANPGDDEQIFERVAAPRDADAIWPDQQPDAPQTPVTDQASLFVEEDMPTPIYKPDTSPRGLTAEEVRAYYQSVADPRDPNEVAASLARAQRRRADKDAAREAGLRATENPALVRSGKDDPDSR
ncbi:hypothetical protein OF122_01955 [Pelagibacterium flavum]|uniref:Tyr recombinase domain-containing protein n=1 Tax=Pelagibacterium flavum TaxID=2984530 RepID=A0ABY6ITG4_9HYPH|nr:hypothetical protein [Pelagibacterium sp. YIM 151497]UYQ72577.1 hypothetical protein OF122_01955 [Pelagibacterium sp. YIM 151497]